jgi:hypothetical protein
LAQTWRSNRLLWSSVPRRYVFLALWIPNGLIVGCEALFVSYSPRHAGLMFAFTALGMLAGDTLVGRFIPAAWRLRLAPWLRLLLAVPYLVFALHPPFGVAVAAATLASPAVAISVMALASITVTLLLAPGLRREPQAASRPEPAAHHGQLAGTPESTS